MSQLNFKFFGKEYSVDSTKDNKFNIGKNITLNVYKGSSQWEVFINMKTPLNRDGIEVVTYCEDLQPAIDNIEGQIRDVYSATKDVLDITENIVGKNK